MWCARVRRLAVLGGAVLALGAAASAQFTPEELAERPRWEEFLRKAKITGAVQMGQEQGVTEPWKLTLEMDGVVRRALWKNPTGAPVGFIENWMYEIAAYELDKLLGLGAVPPTVQRRFRGMAGSCQLWIDDSAILKVRLQEDLSATVLDQPGWLRQGFIQQLFDNLIGNEDRHQGNVLVTSDERPLLIDHSRTFRTGREFTKSLPFTEERFPDVPVMRELPRALVEKVRALDEQSIRKAVGKYLSKNEIRAVLERRALILVEIDKLVAKYGEESVLY